MAFPSARHLNSLPLITQKLRQRILRTNRRLNKSLRVDKSPGIICMRVIIWKQFLRFDWSQFLERSNREFGVIDKLHIRRCSNLTSGFGKSIGGFESVVCPVVAGD